jgi:hypothetical protein
MTRQAGRCPASELPHLPDDRERAPHARGRGREGCEEPVAGRIDLVSAVSPRLSTNFGMMASLERASPAVAELDSHVARADDIGEQQGGQSAPILTPEHHASSLRLLRAGLNSSASICGRLCVSATALKTLHDYVSRRCWRCSRRRPMTISVTCSSVRRSIAMPSHRC